MTLQTLTKSSGKTWRQRNPRKEQMKSPQIEQLLARHPDVLWEYRENVAISSINRKRSHENQVRVGGALLSETVDKYASAARNGVEFPALIGYYDGDDIILCDGNQRNEAFIKANKTFTDLYVILTEDPLERILIGYECNGVLNGVTASVDDDIVHARNLVKQHGYKVRDVAKRFNMSEKRISDGIADFDGNARAKNLGCHSDWLKVENKRHRVRIHNAMRLDSVFILMLKYTAAFNPGPTELTATIGRIASYTSEEDQLNCVRGIISAAERAKKAAEAQKQANKQKHFYSNPAGVLHGHLGYWDKQDVLGIVKAMTTDERTQVRPKIAQAIQTLQKIQAEIGV